MNPSATMIVMIEFLVATALFCYAQPKRGLFWLRLILSLSVSIGASYLLGRFLPNQSIFRFLNFFLQYVFCALSVYVCFKVNPFVAMASAAAGFATQHFCYNLTTFIGVWWGVSSWFQRPVYIVVSLVEDAIFKLPIYVLVFFLVSPRLKKMEIEGRGKIFGTIVSISIVLVCVGITRFTRDTWRRSANTIIAETLYAMVCCMAAIALLLAITSNTKLRKSETTLRVLLLEKNRQMEQKKEDTEAMKIKLHDLNHRLNHLEGMLPQKELDSLHEAIAAYDAPFQTGNPILDIVLTSISVACKKKKIALTCIGDGNLLSFLEEGEVYSLFENACDNAIEAVADLDEAHRQISISLEGAGDLVMLHFDNYYQGSLSFTHGLPETTKKEDKDFHGYGMISMKRIAEHYSGGISITAEDGVFSLTVFLQKPQK